MNSNNYFVDLFLCMTKRPRFVILRFEPTNCPDSYGGGSIPAHAMRAFALCSLLTSPISAISLTAGTSPTPPISRTVEYSGRDFASSCIRVKMRDRELSTVLNTDTASCTSILVDGVLEDSVGTSEKHFCNSFKISYFRLDF